MRSTSRRSRPPSATTCATTSTPSGWKRRASPNSPVPEGDAPPMRAVLLFVALLLGSCDFGKDDLVVYTSVDEIYAREIFAAFTKETGIRVLPVFDTEEAKTLGLV